MKLSDEQRTHLRQTFAQMKNELQVLQQSMESAPSQSQLKEYAYNSEYKTTWEVDDYLLRFRIGNVSDLSMHLLELLKLTGQKS